MAVKARPAKRPQKVTKDAFHGYVAVQGRGNVAIPVGLRRKYHLDEPGAQVEITEREDGVLELRPAVAVPAAEAWFWDERWQAGEREVDAHVAAGEVAQHDTLDDFMAHLDSLDAE
jgi:bifunctional DNA-binding transcriptional regulator/antitoxin component of YhaV-PrlF toxin-antitoxin module